MKVSFARVMSVGVLAGAALAVFVLTAPARSAASPAVRLKGTQTVVDE